jgi:hypothetical protein
MRFPFPRPVRPFFFICGASTLVAAALLTPPAQAAQVVDFTTFVDDPGHWRVVASPYTKHWHPSVEHKPVYALGLERQRDDLWLAGAAYFRNSFGQPSAYVYLGRRWEGFFDTPELFAQVTGGIIYGYVGKYKKKLVLNIEGFAPAVVPSLGWQFNKQAAVSVHFLADAGAMIQFSWDFR